ncbi:Low-density lipoprotein receptor- protein 1B, variant 2 [Homalodisca vitripennis]|nr:Low-density lipoprotein receptor- protein 1B, variant 2 [Homalodisca vitripennis]
MAGGYKNVILLQDMVKDVDYHLARNDVYVMTYRQIIRTPLEGRSTQNYTVIADPEDEYRFTSLAVDWVHEVLYWTSGPILVIHQACLNGFEQRIILRCCYIEKNLNKLLVDPYVGRLFWMTNNEVHSANLQGKEYKKDIFPKISSIRDIAIDVYRQRIYFLAAFSGDDTWFVTSSGYDGGYLKRHVQAPRVMYGLGAQRDEVYWIPHDDDSCVWEGNDVYRHRFTLYSASTEDNSTARPLLMFPEPVWNLRVIQSDLMEGNSSHGMCT